MRCKRVSADNDTIATEKAKAERERHHPPPLLPCNPAQPVGSGADRRSQCRISNWLAMSQTYPALTSYVARLGSRMKCDEDILSVLHVTFNLTRLSQPSPCPMNSGTQTNFVQSMENI